MNDYPDPGGSAARQLAIDELLLDDAEECGRPRESARVWEAPQCTVVIGRSSKLLDEVRLDECRREGVAVCRRASGGASVVIGPGCLMYSLVLSYELRPHLHMLDHAHRFVMETLRDALKPLAPGVEIQGACDLAVDGRKISGNSVRCRRTHLLYHGTLLYDFPLERIDQLLNHPPREPDYRAHRSHGEFVTNLPIPRATLVAALHRAWPRNSSLPLLADDRISQLLATKYLSPHWLTRH